LCRNLDVPIDNVVLESNLFPEIPKQIIFVISMILGKDKDLALDEFVLGDMTSICPFAVKTLTKFNYTQSLANQIHHQLSEFETLMNFRYQSYLVHLLMFTQAFHFLHLRLKFEHEIGNPVSVIHCKSLIKKKTLNVGFLEYIDQLISKSYHIIHHKIPPRIFLDYKTLLQLSLDKRVGDYYIFENYTKIKVYGSDLRPFLLPIFLTPKIFVLEYIRKILNLDDIHFVSRKYKANFKLKKEVGPFIFNTKSTLQVTT